MENHKNGFTEQSLGIRLLPEGGLMKKFLMLLVMGFSISAGAETYKCKLHRLNGGQLIQVFLIKPPEQGGYSTDFPGEGYRVNVWTYETSFGVEINNLSTKSIELSTQITLDSIGGIFDLTFKAADIRLTCNSEH